MPDKQRPNPIDPAGQGVMLGEFGKDVMFWEVENPRSLVNLVPVRVRQLLEEARFQKPHYFEEPDAGAVHKMLMEAGGRINATDNRLRLKFWLELDYANSYYTKQIDLSRVCAGICSTHYFLNKYLTVPEKVAWLLTPPAGYMAKVNEALEFGVDQLRDMLEQPHMTGGKLDAKAAELKLKIVLFLDARKNGPQTMKVAHLHAHTSDKGITRAVAQHAVPQNSMESLQSRVEALRREKEMLQNGGTLVLPAEAVKKVD